MNGNILGYYSSLDICIKSYYYSKDNNLYKIAMLPPRTIIFKL